MERGTTGRWRFESHGPPQYRLIVCLRRRYVTCVILFCGVIALILIEYRPGVFMTQRHQWPKKMMGLVTGDRGQQMIWSELVSQKPSMLDDI